MRRGVSLCLTNWPTDRLWPRGARRLVRFRNLCSSVELATYGRPRKRSLIKMPWTSNDAERHTHKATTSELKELWAKVANQSLERTGDEAELSVKRTR
jgi:hypothetical protein